MSKIKEESEPLSQDEHHRYRSQVARCLFLSQDGADITFIASELCQKMSNPSPQSLAKLKRLARYLETRETVEDKCLNMEYWPRN